MDIRALTRSYEAWVGERVPLVRPDLAYKHELMATGPFPFLRGTFYLWSRRWPELCPELAAAPAVLGVGDLHVENFGTWRDAEGRLVWGVNDFDETHRGAYAQDLVRLAASALLARSEGHLAITAGDACRAVLEGYRRGLAGGAPWVLEEGHGWLRALAVGARKDPGAFWEKLRALPRHRPPLPPAARAAIESLLPRPRLAYEVRRRRVGVGSLGLPRWVALVDDLEGGPIAREVKARAPAAEAWAKGRPSVDRYAALVAAAIRARDPLVRVERGWLVRRLAPDCSRVELETLPRRRDDERLLAAMGREVANVHLGSPGAIPAVRADLRARRSGWLADAARRMADCVIADARVWRRG
jgi:hypothetical protein